MKTEETQADQVYKDFAKTITKLVKMPIWDTDNRKREQALSVLNELPRSVESTKQYEIILSYGMPRCRITGSLDNQNKPETATFQTKDWGLPWKDAAGQYKYMLLRFARLFCFSR